MAVHADPIAQRETAPERSPALVAFLSLITLGIYSWFWYYWINREMRDFGRAHADERLARSRPVRSILAYTIGLFVLVPAGVSLVRATGRVQACSRIAGAGDSSRSVLLWLIGIAIVSVLVGAVATGTLLVSATVVGTVAWILYIGRMQSELNAVWRGARPEAPAA
jgi:hypothetical protein